MANNYFKTKGEMLLHLALQKGNSSFRTFPSIKNKLNYEDRSDEESDDCFHPESDSDNMQENDLCKKVEFILSPSKKRRTENSGDEPKTLKELSQQVIDILHSFEGETVDLNTTDEACDDIGQRNSPEEGKEDDPSKELLSKGKRTRVSKKKSLAVIWHEEIKGRNDEDVTSAFLKCMNFVDFRDYENFVLWLDNCAGQNWTHIHVSRQLPSPN